MNRLLSLPDKVRVWLWVYFLGASFFALFRAVFLFAHRSLISGVSLENILRSFWIGFRFDSVILSIIILPLFLLTLPPFIRFNNRATRIILTSIITALYSLAIILSLADLKYFDRFGSRLNYWAIEYLEYPKLFLYSISTVEDFWSLIIAWLAVSIGTFFIIGYIFRKNAAGRGTPNRTVAAIVYLTALSLLVLGIRGRTGMKPLDWGEAFFSNNQLINQSSLNSAYTLTHSIYEEIKDGRDLFEGNKSRFDFYDRETAYRTTRDMLGIPENSPSDGLSLSHRVRGNTDLNFLPNIVIIIMESWSAEMIGVLGGHPGITPNFDRLSRDGILFRRFYASGIRTNRGIPATLCSFPSLPGRSIMKRYSADYPFRSIAEVLDKFGYQSIFAYGGDIQFDNMKGFLTGVGYDRFYGQDDFPGAEELGRWGIADHSLFDRLLSKIDSFPRPFSLSVMTLSYHDPYLVPDDRFIIDSSTSLAARQRNCYYYTDWALGRFFDEIKQMPVFDSTIFIVTADHCAHQSPKYPLSPETFNIPLLIYAPSLPKCGKGISDAVGSQVDILPTVVGLLGIETDLYCWGRDLLNLRNDDPGFAVITSGSKFGLIEGDYFYFHWLEISRNLYNLNDKPYLETDLKDQMPETARSMEMKLDSYIQMAAYLSRGRSHEPAYASDQ